MQHIRPGILDRELKKGSAELLVLSLVEDQPRHGYDLSKLIEARSGGVLKFRVASLYPLLYRLEKRGWIQGRWIEKAGQRRRRYYRITAAGRAVLRDQRNAWHRFVSALNRVARIREA
jgi:PadR family transcriptional regulator